MSSIISLQDLYNVLVAVKRYVSTGISRITGRVDTLEQAVADIDSTLAPAVAAIGDTVTLMSENQGRVLEGVDMLEHVEEVATAAIDSIWQTTSEAKDEIAASLSVYADGLAALNERMDLLNPPAEEPPTE